MIYREIFDFTFNRFDFAFTSLEDFGYQLIYDWTHKNDNQAYLKYLTHITKDELIDTVENDYFDAKDTISQYYNDIDSLPIHNRTLVEFYDDFDCNRVIIPALDKTVGFMKNVSKIFGIEIIIDTDYEKEREEIERIAEEAYREAKDQEDYYNSMKGPL